MRTTYAYPLRVDANGRLVLSHDEDCDRDAIFSVLETRPGERIERPRYGTPDFVFESVARSVTIPGQIEAALTDQIGTVQQFEVSGEIADEGTLDLTIAWTAQVAQSTALRLLL
jgi:uncharacterized protein